MRLITPGLIISALLPLALATLPRSLQLYAFNNGQQIGCINGYGWFTQNLQWCGILHTDLTVDPKSTLRAYDYCSTNTGTLECYPNSGVNGTFYQSGNNLATDTNGESFAIATLPADKTDKKGVRTIVGNGAIPLTLNVRAVSG